jgi:hypothetical protein
LQVYDFEAAAVLIEKLDLFNLELSTNTAFDRYKIVVKFQSEYTADVVLAHAMNKTLAPWTSGYTTPEKPEQTKGAPPARETK